MPSRSYIAYSMYEWCYDAVMQVAAISEARTKIKSLFDAAEAGLPVSMSRSEARVALVDAERLRYVLGRLMPPAEAFHEAGSWWVLLRGLGLYGDGASLDEAVDDAVCALREYAEDWVDHLHADRGHGGRWGLVQFVSLSSDQQLRDWLLGGSAD